MSQTPGWQQWAEKTKSDCEQVGKAIIWPMLDEKVVMDRITRANERLRVISEIESMTKQVEGLKTKWTALTGQEKI